VEERERDRKREREREREWRAREIRRESYVPGTNKHQNGWMDDLLTKLSEDEAQKNLAKK